MAIRVRTEAGERATTIRIEGRLMSGDVDDVRLDCESAKPPLGLDLSGLLSADSEGIRALHSLSEAGRVHLPSSGL